MLATGALFPSIRFDFVVSGVNRGDNLGRHVIYSGTVAGAREGAMKTGGVGVAVSLCSYSRDADYSDAASVAAETLTAVRLLPIRPRSRGERRSLRTFPVVTLHPRFPFNVRLTGKTFD